jgi:predicted transcriptional regulator
VSLNHPSDRDAATGINALTDRTPEAALDFTGLAAEIVSAYVSNNPVPPAELPALIAKTHAAIAALANGNPTTEAAEEAIERLTPAQIRKSIRDDGIVSFIDGKSYKTLKRHLSANGLDPRSYRERYGLPADYPMTAPSYAAQRSELARAIGLGRPGAQIERQKLGRKAS